MKALYTFLACALLTASVTVQPMDIFKKKPKKEVVPVSDFHSWAIDAGDIILGDSNIKEKIDLIRKDKNFLKLPSANQKILLQLLPIAANPESSSVASTSIKNLVHNANQLNGLINTPEFTLALIKHYSKILDIGNETAAQVIATRGSQKLLTARDKIMVPIRHSSMPELPSMREMRTSFDLSFTNTYKCSAAQECLLLGHVQAVKMFLAAGIDPEPLLDDALWLKKNRKIGTIDIIISILEKAVDEKELKKNTLMKEADKSNFI